jgi:multiple sugar transport system permease protein
MFFAFLLASLLNLRIRGMSVFRTLFYLPYVVPSIAASVLWLWLLNRRHGLINYALGLVGLPPLSWLSDEHLAKPALVLLSLWSIGGLMVIYLAALQGIPKELHEAVEVDGGNWWHKLIHITLPLMTPTFFFTLILGIIGASQVFQAAFVITQGGPLRATLFYMLHTYNRAFRDFDMGYASALAWVLFVIVLILTVILFRGSRFWVYYEGEEA